MQKAIETCADVPLQHKTKIIITAGPSCLDNKTLLKLAQNGMNVVRLNMTHGDQDWHADVIQRVRGLNEQGSASAATHPIVLTPPIMAHHPHSHNRCNLALALLVLGRPTLLTARRVAMPQSGYIYI